MGGVLDHTVEPTYITYYVPQSLNGAMFMYQRLLVPLDGSRLAEQVIPYVHVLGNHLKCPIAIVRAFALPYMLESADEATIDRVSTDLRHQAREYLNQVSTCLLYTSPSPRDRG